MDDTDYKLLKALNKKQQDKVESLSWEIADTPGGSSSDPRYVKARQNLADTTSWLSEHEQANRKVDEEGKLTAPPLTRLPSEILSDKSKAGPGGFDYHFEPSVTEAQKAYQADPQLATRLGIDPAWLSGVAQAERSEPVTDPTTGQVVGRNVVPGKSHLETMTEGDEPYKAYADHLWTQKMEEGKSKGINRQRYRDIHFRKGQIGDYLLGGVMKGIERVVDPFKVGVSNSMTAGLAGPAADALNERFGDEGVVPKTQDIINRNPFANLAGEIAGYALPGNLTNIAQEALTKSGTKLLGDFGTTALGRGVVSAGTGAAANVGEGAVRDVAQAMGPDQTLGEAAGNAFENMPMNFVLGGGGGVLGEAIGKGLGAAKDAIGDMPRMKAINVLKRGGGDTGLVRGVVPTPEMKANIRAVAKGEEHGSPPQVAAKPLAEQMRLHLDKRTASEAQAIQRQMEEYFNHPAYADLEVSTRPLLDTLVDLANQGRFRSAISRTGKNVDPKKVNTVRKQIANLGEVVAVPRGQAQAEAIARDGTIIDPELARELFDTVVPAGSVGIVVGEPMSAQLLTDMEKMIDDELGFARRSTGNDDPVYTKLNFAIKKMRDQFPLWQDEAGNLVAPPGWTPGGSSSGVPSSGAASSAQSTPPVPSSVPSAAPSSPGGLPSSAVSESPDFVDSVESIDVDPMTSSRMEVEPDTFSRTEVEPETFSRTEVEPDTYSREYAEPIPGENTRKMPTGIPPTEKMKRLPRDMGPKRRDFDDYHSFMDARAEWRIARGQPKPGDVERVAELNRLKNAQPEGPVVQEAPPEPSEVQPSVDTKRSISPDNEATPLSLLAGNKLAMDVPDQPFAPTGGARDYPDESLPGPMAKDWAESDKETGEWFEDIVSPGRDPRSDEARRMGDLTNQQQALEEARGQVANVEQRLGQMDEETRLKSILGILSNKLGREVTKDDLVRAGLMTGGVAAASTGDEELGEAGVGAMVLGGFGRRKQRGKPRTSPPGGPSSIGGGQKGPRELTGKLDDGTELKGFSALRNKQSRALDELKTLQERTGVERDKATIEKMTRFNMGNNILDDEALLAVAKELGIEEQLRKVAGASAYQDLNERAFGMGGDGVRRGAADFFGLRGDKIMQILSGEPRNPFNRIPHGPLSDATRTFFNLTGGRLGARHGDDAQRIWETLFPGEEQPVEEQPKQ